EAELAKAQRRAAGGGAFDPAFVRFPKFRAHRLQHGTSPLSDLETYLDASTVATRATLLALSHALVLRHRIVLQDLALEDPHLDAAGAIGGERSGDTVIDVGAQRMQRHPAFPIPLQAGDFGAAEPARTVDADALRAEPHSRLHGP